MHALLPELDGNCPALGGCLVIAVLGEVLAAGRGPLLTGRRDGADHVSLCFRAGAQERERRGRSDTCMVDGFQ